MKWEDSKKGFENFLRLEKSLSQNSIAAYVNDINKLMVFLEGNFKRLAPEKVKLNHLKSFVEDLNSRGFLLVHKRAQFLVSSRSLSTC